MACLLTISGVETVSFLPS